MREGWEIRKLGDICEIKNGRNQKNVENPNGHYPIYGSGGVMGYADDFICKAGTTIIGRKGTINKPLFVDCAFWNVDTAFGLQPKEETNPRFLFYTCKSIDFTRYNKSTTLPSLVKNDLLKIELHVPPFAEQEKIVAELDCLTSIIEKKKQQLEELDNLAKSIFYDMFGDPITNEKGWDKKILGDEFSVMSGGTPSTKEPSYWDNGTISWIGSNMCQNAIIYANDGKYITQEGLDHSASKLFHSGFVLIALVGATIGKVGLLKIETTTNQNIAGIDVPANKSYSSAFVFYLLQGLYSLFENIGEGKFKMANLSFVRSLKLITPPLNLQNEFAQKIEAIEEQKRLIKKSIQETETLFNSRMDYWFK